MLISLLLVAHALAGGGQTEAQAGAQTDLPEPSPLTSTIDRDAARHCLGSMVGFRNVQLQCVSGADGRLQQCEVNSQNPRVLRYTRVFRCMAGAITVTNPDGSLAVGRSVTFQLNGRSWQTTPAQERPRD